MASSALPTYIHDQPKRTLLPLLSTHFLPACVPLVRRLQFHYTSANAVAIATFPPSASPASPASPEPRSTANDAPAHPLHPFAVVLLDRSRAPETEAWIFSSVETRRTPATIGTTAAASVSAAEARLCRAQLLAVLAHAERIPVPAGYPADADPHLMKLGSVHELALALLMGWQGGSVDSVRRLWRDGVAVAQAPAPAPASADAAGTPGAADPTDIKPGSALHAAETAPLNTDIDGGGGIVLSHTIPYVKFIIDPTHTAHQPAPAPPGLVWDRARPSDYALVIGRTHIPRRPRTLALLPSAVLRIGRSASDGAGDGAGTGTGPGRPDQPDWTPDTAHTQHKTTPGRPVGWAFLSPDASLASLHVEEGYRGRGLGTLLAQRVIGLLGPQEDAEDTVGDGVGPTDSADASASGVRVNGSAGAEINEVRALDNVRGAFPLHTRRDQAYVHADIARDNAASQGVMRRLGGREAWEAFWVVASLRRASECARDEARRSEAERSEAQLSTVERRAA